MDLQDVYRVLDLSPDEAAPLIREAGIPGDRERLAVTDLVRMDTALERICHKLAGRDWRRADGADRQQHGVDEISPYDLFHRKTGERRNLKTFGQLLRWAESEYGWKA
jgi:hypothetical protein